MRPLMIISSDGHAAGRMDDYRTYMEPALREEFDAFCTLYRERGAKSAFADRSALIELIDPEEVDKWEAAYIEPGRLDGTWNVDRRLKELEAEGVCAEVLIPDFGLPFELYPAPLARIKNWPPRTQEQVDAGNRAYNRWLADFCSQAPERFAGMASISFTDVEAAVEEAVRVKQAGLKGVMIPMFDSTMPLFHPRFDPVWSTLADLELPANSHASISSTSTQVFHLPGVPHPGCHGPLSRAPLEFFCHNVLDHLIWGGVLERHPKLRVVFTEQGSAWLPTKLRAMDYSYTGSYLRRDLKSVIRHRPSEYFARQCWIGSSLLACSEVEYRHVIGVEKMMIGVDYPHHEGTWNGGTLDYLQATLGAADVPLDEARRMLGETAASVFGFDQGRLTAVVDRVGPQPERVLRAPQEDKFPRGDVHKPLGAWSL
jgi:predicted TIM-barrel fold metal-dependent hydrolase